MPNTFQVVYIISEAREERPLLLSLEVNDLDMCTGYTRALGCRHPGG